MEDTPKRGRGQPTKLTPERSSKIIEGIKLCLPLELACQCANVTYQTFRNWMIAGETQKRGKFFDFFNAVHAAENLALEGCMATVIKNVKAGNWKAATWILERRHRAFFSRTITELEAGSGSFESLLAQLGNMAEQRAVFEGRPPARPGASSFAPGAPDAAAVGAAAHTSAPVGPETPLEGLLPAKPEPDDKGKPGAGGNGHGEAGGNGSGNGKK